MGVRKQESMNLNEVRDRIGSIRMYLPMHGNLPADPCTYVLDQGSEASGGRAREDRNSEKNWPD
jgi:hypothetical protein